MYYFKRKILLVCGIILWAVSTSCDLTHYTHNPTTKSLIKKLTLANIYNQTWILNQNI